MDINHLYLKLRFAGMTTRQIHQLFNYECDFGSYNKREQQYKLKLYLTKIKSTKKWVYMIILLSMISNLFYYN